MSTIVICWALLVGLLGQQPVPSSSTSTSLDYEFFKAKVQPIFLAKRPGHARCVSCHAASNGPVLLLQPLSPGSTTWNEERVAQELRGGQASGYTRQLEKPTPHPPARRRGWWRFLSQWRQALQLAETTRSGKH